MLIRILFLALAVLLAGSTAQQDLDIVCSDSYADFEGDSVGSNVSGNKLRTKLYEAFYAPNRHSPFSVLVTYQLVLSDGTRFNLSSEPNCSTELWMWLSSPVFMKSTGGTHYSGSVFLIFTLDYFTEWELPHVTINTTVSPCPDKTSDFLSEMTASLHDYALGQMKDRTNLGYVQRGCGLSISDTVFVPVGWVYSNPMLKVLGILQWFGNFFQLLSVWLVSAVLLKLTFKEYAKKTFTYSYDVYGMFWGVSTTAFGILGVFYGTYTAIGVTYFTNIKEPASQPTTYIILLLVGIPPVAEIPVAYYAARKATVAVPCIIRYPLTVLCCGRRERAERFITATALWADLVALQQVLFVGIGVVRYLPAAPFAIASNLMLFVLSLTCITNFFSLLFTIFANTNVFTSVRQREGSSSMVLQAIVVLPLLLMIMCYGAYFAYLELVTNTDTKNKNNPLSFISSIIPPILLGVITVFLKKFVSAWLKWSPQNPRNATDTAQRREGIQDLERGMNTSQAHDDDDEQLLPS